MSGTGGYGAVTRSTLRQQIADALRDEVLAGRLQPGQEFTVKEIAEQYGVSATPVREALVDLSAQGLLDADQHRGFRVHEYSLEDFRDMTEARALITDGIFRNLLSDADALTGAVAGGSAAEAVRTVDGRPAIPAGPRVRAAQAALAAGTDDPRTAAALTGVRRRGEEAQRAAEAGDMNILIGYDLRFWRELSALFGNPYLADFLHRLRVQSWACAVQHLRRLPDLRGCLWSGHGELVDALADRDAAAAHAIVTAYNTHTLALIDRLAGE